MPALADAHASVSVIRLRMEYFVLDLVYVIGILAVFALVGVIAKGVEKLAPTPRTSGPRAAISEDVK